MAATLSNIVRGFMGWPWGRALQRGYLTESTPLPPVHWVDCNPCGNPCDPQNTAFAVPAFLACVRVIAESVASLPKRLILRGRDGSRNPVTDHWFYRLVHDSPNGWQSSFEYFETLASDVAAWGNHYSLKVFNDAGEVESLLPIEPWRVTVSQLQSGMLVYDYMAPNGDSGRWRDDQILHVRGMSRDSITGECPVHQLTGPLGLAKVMEKHSTRFWANSAKPGIILETTAPIPKEALVEMRRQFEQFHSGAENAGRTAALPAFVTAKPLGGSSADTEQMIETRTFIIQEIARAMRVPPTMIGENSRSTYSNAENEMLSWVTNSLSMWCNRIEGAFQRSMLNGLDDENGSYSLHVDVRGLLRGDSAARAAWYQTLWGIGAISTNEIRALEDMPQLEDEAANEPFIPANNVRPLSQAYELDGQAMASDGVRSRRRDSRGRFCKKEEVQDVAAA